MIQKSEVKLNCGLNFFNVYMILIGFIQDGLHYKGGLSLDYSLGYNHVDYYTYYENMRWILRFSANIVWWILYWFFVYVLYLIFSSILGSRLSHVKDVSTFTVAYKIMFLMCLKMFWIILMVPHTTSLVSPLPFDVLVFGPIELFLSWLWKLFGSRDWSCCYYKVFSRCLVSLYSTMLYNGWAILGASSWINYLGQSYLIKSHVTLFLYFMHDLGNLGS